MPPVISKLANATDLEQRSMSSSVHDENVSVCDFKSAYIISDVIFKLKFEQSQVNSKKKGLAKFHVLYAQRM